MTIGAWPDDPMVFQITVGQDRKKINWGGFVWIGGLQDETNGKRIFFALPPASTMGKVDWVRRAFGETVSYPGVFAEAKFLEIDISKIRPLSTQETEAAVARLSEGRT